MKNLRKQDDLLERVDDLAFAPKPNVARVLRMDMLPPGELTTSALGLFFQGDRLLMSNLVRRGWDIPGGHIEAGESPEETVRRETWEETGVELGSIRLFAAQCIEILAPQPPGYPYPYPVSYQVFFCGDVAALGPFTATEEVCDRGLFEPVAAQELAWVKAHSAMYATARSLVTQER